MRVFLIFITMFFLACSSQNKDWQALENLQPNEGVSYVFEGKVGSKEYDLYVEILKIKENVYSVGAKFSQFEGFFEGFMDENKSFTLENLYLPQSFQGNFYFDDDILGLKAKLDTQGLIFDMDLKLSDKKLNQLHFIKQDFEQETFINGEKLSFHRQDNFIFIPYSTKLEKEAVSKLNTNLSFNVSNLQELRQLAQKEQEDFFKEQGFSNESNVEFINDHKLYFSDDKIALFLVNQYEYLGGNHGLSFIGSRIFSLESGEELSNSTKDLFKDTQDEIFLEFILRSLDEKYGYDLNYDNFELTPTFFVDEEGLELVWQPYELASYAMGHINLRLGFKELKPFINEKSPLAYLFE
ncbi:hypothetical protein DMB92_04660 [Campylobacter sp. MIT 99-7217]|uniref:RsiV family protein n=1 Tax=Campylobacter sp. MIT 99-7217 TaxID=535091 RepID=UPI00115767EC|nr:RsiV family protein [Campylobacter sp. MIT 99-7217]TQR32392.1 hypothetical protein DMB92_04660 [Campylobacter sp. MIT 99-7217]